MRDDLRMSRMVDNRLLQDCASARARGLYLAGGAPVRYARRGVRGRRRRRPGGRKSRQDARTRMSLFRYWCGRVESIGGPYGNRSGGSSTWIASSPNSTCAISRSIRSRRVTHLTPKRPSRRALEYGVETEVAARPFGGARQPHTPAWAAATEVDARRLRGRGRDDSALRQRRMLPMARSPRRMARRWSSSATATS